MAATVAVVAALLLGSPALAQPAPASRPTDLPDWARHRYPAAGK